MRDPKLTPCTGCGAYCSYERDDEVCYGKVEFADEFDDGTTIHVCEGHYDTYWKAETNT